MADYCAPVLYPTATSWSADLARRLWVAIEAELPTVDQVLLEKMPERVGDLINPLFLLSDEANPESCHGSNLLPPWPEVATP